MAPLPGTSTTAAPARPSASSRRGRGRAWVRRAHLVLALGVGLLFVVSGLTGSALVFRDEIESLFMGDTVRVAPGPDVGLARAWTAATEAAAPDRLAMVRLPSAPDRPYAFWFGDAPWRILYVDPADAEVLGEQRYRSGLLGVLSDLHINLLAGETGHRIMGFAALALVVLLISGAWLAWPRRGDWRQVFRLRLSGGRTLALLDLHRVMGAVGWVLLLVSVLTGLMLVFHHTSSTVLTGVLGGRELPAPPAAPRVAGGTALPAPVLMERARAAMPGAAVTWLRPAALPGHPFLVRMRFPEDAHPNGTTYVALHPQTGAVLSTFSSREDGAGGTLNNLKYPLHIGTALALPGRIAVFVAGLMPAVLLVTGLVMWRRRSAARATRRA